MCRALLRSLHPCKSLCYIPHYTLWFTKLLWLGKDCSQDPSTSTLPRGRWGGGLQGSPALLFCYRGAGHGGAKANQGLIKDLQKTSRFSDEAAQGKLLPFLEKKCLHDPPVHHLEVFPGKPSTRKDQTALNVTKTFCHSSPLAAVPGTSLQSSYCFILNSLPAQNTLPAVGAQEHSPCIGPAWLLH